MALDDENDVSMEDTLRETLRGLNADEKGAIDTPDASEAVATVEEESPETPAAPKEGERARGEDGKFLKKEAAPTVKEVPAEATAIEVPAEEPWRKHDPRWKKYAKDHLATLPPNVREDIIRADWQRDQDFHNGITQYKDAAAFGSTVRKVVEPYMPLITAEGGTPERAIASLLQTAAIFRQGTQEQKQQALRAVAQQYGVALPYAQAGGSTAQPQSFDGVSPEQADALQQNPALAQMFQPLLTQLTSLQGELKAIKDKDALRERQMQDSYGAEVNATIESFAKEHDKDGWMDDWKQSPDGSRSPGPFRRLMSSALESGQATTLNEAYEIAKWASPESRKVEIARQQSAAQEAARKAKAVEDAKKSASVNVRTRGALPAAAPNGSMEDTIRGKLRELTG